MDAINYLTSSNLVLPDSGIIYMCGTPLSVKAKAKYAIGRE